MELRRNTKRIFTAALAGWLSGIVVLFCCGTMPTKAAENESCPLAKKGHCTKTAETNAEHSFEKQLPTFDCCAFPAKIFDKVRKLEKLPESATFEETIEIAAPNFFVVEQTFKSPKFRQSFVRNRGSTYLLNRVFRI